MNTSPAPYTKTSRTLLPSWARLSRWISVFSAASTMAVAPLGYAQSTPPKDPTARAEWLSSEAEKAFQQQRFTDAIKLYLDAWENAPSAGLLYNIAFIYDRRLSDPELAIQYYDRAARSDDATPELKTRVQKRTGELRAELEAARSTRQPSRPNQPTRPQPPTTQPQTPPTQTGTQTQPVSNPLPVIQQGQSSPSESSGGSAGPWILLSVGGASLVGGVVMGFMATGTHDDFEDARDLATKRDLQSKGRTQALVADIFMGVGVASLIGGIVWAAVDSSGSTDTAKRSDFRIEPIMMGQGAGVVFGGSL